MHPSLQKSHFFPTFFGKTKHEAGMCLTLLARLKNAKKQLTPNANSSVPSLKPGPLSTKANKVSF